MSMMQLTVSRFWDWFSLKNWQQSLGVVTPNDTVDSIQSKLSDVLWDDLGLILKWTDAADFVSLLKERSCDLLALIVDEEILAHNLLLKSCFIDAPVVKNVSGRIYNMLHANYLINTDDDFLNDAGVMFFYGTRAQVRKRIQMNPESVWSKSIVKIFEILGDVWWRFLEE